MAQVPNAVVEEDERQELKYESVLPVAEPDVKFQTFDEETGTWKIHADFKLIKTLDELREYAKTCEGIRIAVDTETTGLTYYEDMIVGFSVSKSSYEGIYVPIRHQIRTSVKVKEIKMKDGEPVLTKTGKVSMHTVEYFEYAESPHNLPAKEALDILFYDIMCKAKLVLMHNSDFDLNMLRHEGYDVKKAKTFDTVTLSYTYDPEARLNQLKPLTERVLGRKVQHFDEVTGGDELFRYTDPNESYEYACCHDKDTEVFTEKGWVRWEKYNGIDKLGTINTDTGLFEYQAPLNIIKYRYEGKMIQYKSKLMNFCVTPNHNMLVYHGQDKSGKLVHKEAQKFGKTEILPITLRGRSDGNKENFPLDNGKSLTSHEFAIVAALALTIGEVNKTDTGYEIKLHFSSHNKHIKYAKFLKSIEGAAEVRVREGYKKAYYWYSENKELGEILYEAKHAPKDNKFIPQRIKDLDVEDLRTFIHYYYTFNNYYDGKYNAIKTKSARYMNDLSTILMLAGYYVDTKPSYRRKFYLGEGRSMPLKEPKITYNVCFREYAYYTQLYRSYPRWQEVDYNDYVYCAEVPNHSLITRRKGKTLISGNCDSADTYGIYLKLFPLVKDLLEKAPEKLVIDGKPYNILKEDNDLIRAFVDYYDHCEMLIDKEAAIKYKELIDNETSKTISEIYQYFGKGQFSLSVGSKEFQQTMKEFGFDTGFRTDKGKISFGKKGVDLMTRNLNKFKNTLWQYRNDYVFMNSRLLWNMGKDKTVKNMAFLLGQFLKTYGTSHCKMDKGKATTSLGIYHSSGDKLSRRDFIQLLANIYKAEKKKLEILKLILKYTSLQKALNSYVNKLTELDKCRMRYRLTGTKSSRLSSGNGAKSDKKKNRYYSDLSAQTLTKPKSQWYKGVPAEKDDPLAVHGWRFYPVTNEYYQEHSHDEIIVEGFKQEANIRSCIIAPENRLVCSMDYNSEELVAIALLSGDNVMLDGFRRGEDPHKTTAIGIWGEENYNVNIRKKAKTINFMMSYQGGPRSLSESLDIPIEEAQDIISKYKNTYHECIYWKEQEVIKMMNRHGLIYTKFGRPRQLGPYLDMAFVNNDDGIRAYAERSVCSHHVQGFCGDICRLDMNKFYKQLVCNPEHRPHIDFLSFIHDELNTTIDKDKIEKYVRILEDIMIFPYLDPTLPISTGLELGHRLGDLYPFCWNDPKSKDYLIPERSYFK